MRNIAKDDGICRLRFSILVDNVRGVYVPQYSKDGRYWYSFENIEQGYTLIFRTLEEARQFLKNPETKLKSILTL